MKVHSFLTTHYNITYLILGVGYLGYRLIKWYASSNSPKKELDPIGDTLKQRRILLISSGPGKGHLSAAIAIVDVLKRNGATTEIFHFTSIEFKERFSKIKKEKKDLDKKIYEFAPNLLISTAYHRKDLVLDPAKEHKIKSVIIYLDHWDGKTCFTSSGEKESKTGISDLCKDRNLVEHWYPYELQDSDRTCKRLGVPVRKSFQAASPAETLVIREHLGLVSDKKVILLLAGGNPETKMVLDTIKDFQESWQYVPLHLLVVCGFNSSLKAILQKKPYKQDIINSLVHLSILGQQNEQEMSNLMKAADLIITKPGGITIGEILQIGKEAVFLPPLQNIAEPKNTKVCEEMGFIVQNKNAFLSLFYHTTMIYELLKYEINVNLEKISFENFSRHLISSVEKSDLKLIDDETRLQELIKELYNELVHNIEAKMPATFIFAQCCGALIKDFSIAEATRLHFEKRLNQKERSEQELMKQKEAVTKHGYLPGWEERIVQFIQER